MSNVHAVRFLQNREKDDLESRLSSKGVGSLEARVQDVLSRHGMVWVSDLPQALGVAEEDMLPVVSSLVRQGRIQVMERTDGSMRKFLTFP